MVPNEVADVQSDGVDVTLPDRMTDRVGDGVIVAVVVGVSEATWLKEGLIASLTACLMTWDLL